MRLPIVIFIAMLPYIVYAQSHRYERQRSVTSRIYSAATSDAPTQPSLSSPQIVDSILTPELPFTPMAVSMHGYSKKLRDAKESFILRNETCCYRISRVLLRIVYIDANGSKIAERDELIECDMAPGATQELEIKSFDKEKQYYYYTTPPQRANGMAYMIQYNVLRYDVVVE